MAKFEGNYPAEAKEAPAWFRPFYQNFGLVVKFLNSAGRRGLNLNDNILNINISQTVTTDTPTKFQHNLGVTPVGAIPQGGRFLYYTQLSSDKNVTVLNFQLINSQITDTVDENNVLNIHVLNPNYFKVNDKVSIGNQVRKIINIAGNGLILDAPIRLSLPAMVVLNSENISVIFL